MSEVLIAARVDRNRGGSTNEEYRLYALKGQVISDRAAIQCPLSERTEHHLGRHFLLLVAMTKGKVKAPYPYMVKKHTQRMQPVTEEAAIAFVRERASGAFRRLSR